MKATAGFSVLGTIAFAVLSVPTVYADSIAGPTLTLGDGGYEYSGVGFTANIDAALTSFTFENQGAADTVELVDPFGNVLDSIDTPAGTPSYTASMNWSLTAGDQYYLLQSTPANSLFALWGMAAPSDTEIAMTDTADFSLTSPASADFSIGGGAAFSATLYWVAFNDITTGPPTPEPASAMLVLPFAAALLLRVSRGRVTRKSSALK